MALQPTITVNVVDKSIPPEDHSLIAIIGEANPCMGYEINEEQLRQLIQLPRYWITDAATGKTINGVNIYDYFPKKGGGGRTPILIEKTIDANGTYLAVNDQADGYKKAIVLVPNTYTAEDEGKVVDNGTLIAQTAYPTTITANDTYDTTHYNSIVVDVESPLPDRFESDVRFYDYDGQLLYSYDKAEFLALTEMPTNPSHEGLTAQGWNWSLTDAKAYVNKYGSLDIGQMYITDDGKTRFYITLPEGRTSPTLQLYLNNYTTLDIDWGDRTNHSTLTSTSAGYKSARHEYTTPGDYVIAITVTTGSFIFQSLSITVSSILWNGNNNNSSPDRVYNNALKRVEVGNNVSIIGSYSFYNCYALQSITIPKSVTILGSSIFYNCYSLSFIVLPDSITSISDSFVSSKLEHIILGNGITIIGQGAFTSAQLLSSINIPDTVTSIGSSAFANCSALTSINIPNTIQYINSALFNSCQSLSSINIPNNVTNIEDFVFSGCYSLASVTIPDNVTSIAQYAFQACYSLATIIVGSHVTSIGQYAFQSCTYLESIKFKSYNPPTIANSNAWNNTSTTFKIYVPRGRLNAYKSATNYPNPSTYTYIEY